MPERRTMGPAVVPVFRIGSWLSRLLSAVSMSDDRAASTVARGHRAAEGEDSRKTDPSLSIDGASALRPPAEAGDATQRRSDGGAYRLYFCKIRTRDRSVGDIEGGMSVIAYAV